MDRFFLLCALLLLLRLSLYSRPYNFSILNIVEDNIYTLIRKIALPASIGFIFITLYNVVDTYFAGNHISSEALAGVTYIFPLYLIMMAFGAGMSGGTTALATQALGQKDTDKTIAILYNSFRLLLWVSILLGLIIWFATGPIIRLMGATGIALEAGINYMKVTALSAPFFLGTYLLNSVLTIQGDTKSFRNSVIIAFFINIVLNSLFILYFSWGVVGLAAATFIVQIISVLYLLFRVQKSTLFANFTIDSCITDYRLSKKIMKQGLPATLNILTMSSQLFLMNSYVDAFGGQNAVAGMGTAFRVEQLIIVPTIALNIAALTIMGHNYGARNIDRIIQTLKATIVIGIGIVTIGIVLIYIFGADLIFFFDPTPEVVSFGTRYLEISAYTLTSYVIIGACTATLQSLQRPIITLFISVFRRIIVTWIAFEVITSYYSYGIDGIFNALKVLPWLGASLFILLTVKVITIQKKRFQTVIPNEF